MAEGRRDYLQTMIMNCSEIFTEDHPNCFQPYQNPKDMIMHVLTPELTSDTEDVVEDGVARFYIRPLPHRSKALTKIVRHIDSLLTLGAKAVVRSQRCEAPVGRPVANTVVTVNDVTTFLQLERWHLDLQLFALDLYATDIEVRKGRGLAHFDHNKHRENIRELLEQIPKRVGREAPAPRKILASRVAEV